MFVHPSGPRIWISIGLAGLVHAHQGPYHPSVYALYGTGSEKNLNNNGPSTPMYQLNYTDYWMHGEQGSEKYAPDDGIYMDLSAGDSVIIEIADNIAWTSLNPHRSPTEWGDGKNHSEPYDMDHLQGQQPSDSNCLPSPNLHVKNKTEIWGSSLGIAYKSNTSEVVWDDVVIFSVNLSIPWKREAEYKIPSGMPPCPDPGWCTCTWHWFPRACGQQNMYMHPFRCRIIPDSNSPKTIGAPQVPVWCKDDPSACVKGPKGVIIAGQNERNNVFTNATAPDGIRYPPGYNPHCGFNDGAQEDIFVSGTASTLPMGFAAPTPSTTSSQPASSSAVLSSSASTGTGTPTSSSAAYTSSSPTVSSTFNSPTASSTPANSRKRSNADPVDGGQAAHMRRMKARREMKNILGL